MNDQKPREWWIQFAMNGEEFVHTQEIDDHKNYSGTIVHVIEYGGECKMQIGEHTVLADSEDFHFLSRFTWHIRKSRKTHYAFTNVKIGGKNCGVSMHRMITGMVSNIIDHKNRNGLDNRKANLRFATHQQNQCNRVRDNRHGFRGVTHDKNNGWRCQISFGGKRYVKGGFATAEEAAREYDKLSKEHHGEFGIRNFED